ncbi:hypothetical protein Tco_0907810 [Tanacetum coccineum]|uniref:Uncharacterized protein n=1 Tax=Tanacetum coccineum TaxID=301880 RepID=A0ABQ5CLH7_9ASTR
MAALGVVRVIEVDAHKSMTFRDAVACEQAEIWVAKGLVNEAKENILGTPIFRNRSGDTMRVSQFMFSNGMFVEILLGRHSTFLLEGGLLGNHDKENKDVGMLDEVYHGLQMDIHVFVDSKYPIGRSITIMGISITRRVVALIGESKENTWLKELSIESGFELRLVAGIATRASMKAVTGLRFKQWLKLIRLAKVVLDAWFALEDGGLQDKNTSNGRATRQVHEVTNDGNPNKAGLESIMKEVPTSYAQ